MPSAAPDAEPVQVAAKRTVAMALRNIRKNALAKQAAAGTGPATSSGKGKDGEGGGGGGGGGKKKKKKKGGAASGNGKFPAKKVPRSFKRR